MLRRRILWDVVEQHLDESAFFWSQRERALLSLEDVLAEVTEGDEGRLLAHLEGLRVHGAPVIERLLQPALEGDDWARAAVAAHVLLATPELDGSGQVRDALVRSEPEARRGLLGALELSGRKELDQLLMRLLPEAGPGLRGPLLGCLAFRQVDTGVVLRRLSLEGAPGTLTAALRAARFTSQDVAAGLVARGLTSSHPQERDAALLTGLRFHAKVSWALCRRLVEAGGPSLATAMIALAVGGGPREVELLVKALAVDPLRADAAWALGFSGRRAAAEALLDVLRKGGGGWLEAESFAAITGMPLEGVLAAAREDAAEEEAAPMAADEEQGKGALPGPVLLPGTVRVEAVDAWWQREQSRFDKAGRYLYGSLWSVKALVDALEVAPMRRRPALAWELAVRSGGACQLETRAWTWEQRRQLQAARGLRFASGSQPFESFLKEMPCASP
ncbi:TIGR02270 family protein [Vitiosangium sp. GDMCC 1.1324]|uniref:TIGR02270 family protein n=1 Tax=Vitiosangium sp. (strain GDMCC 1.1324) TaxID=2138576 RepID=UPI000D3C3750|nr:TIGR02270 family protein [Vitiosangium sp. GDMCC 1.1324]PTL83416.1 hypothetical protein DAT35_15700 [Vitiosangium sp. GDMCC 1.1324]